MQEGLNSGSNKRMALGLFHFNLLYVAGDTQLYYRYCTEAVIPFLNVVYKNAWFRTTFECSGIGLEFIKENFPTAFARLKELVESKRLELISSTYYPTVWIAFPARDLIESVKINRGCLQRLGLPQSSVFFSQECFFGRGLSCIADQFSIVLCKDDYLVPQQPNIERLPVYAMAGMRVVVGSNHLGNRAHDGAQTDIVRNDILGPLNLNVSRGYSGFEKGSFNGTEWKWYHFGSGHHLSSPSPPTDKERFIFDCSWLVSNISYLETLHQAGYTFSFITEFAERFSNDEIKSLPFVVEGSWNYLKSKGVYQWMGGASVPWQDSPAILALACKSRERILQYEALLLQGGQISDSKRSELQGLWTRQIMAECSDPHGWAPLPSEVQFGRSAAEASFSEASRLLLETSLELNFRASPAASEWTDGDLVESPVKITIIGKGSLAVRRISPHIYQVETRASQEQNSAGIQFQRVAPEVTYCCSGEEARPSSFFLGQMHMNNIYLPLANGLVNLGSGRFLIRINAFGYVAGMLSQLENTITFQAAVSSRILRQKFLIYEGSLEPAVAMANSINFGAQ